MNIQATVGDELHQQEPGPNPSPSPNPLATNQTTTTTTAVKKRRNLPESSDRDAEVLALSPRTLMATNRFICEICNKGFQREQNLQLHMRGHNLPLALRQHSDKVAVKKKVYICPEKSCVHHNPSRALRDLKEIKKHFSRKHGEKKWKCDKCSKRYVVQSDWKAHTKICGTREYKCDCGTLFSRKDNFIVHRAFCDALAEESVRFPFVTPSSLSYGLIGQRLQDATEFFNPVSHLFGRNPFTRGLPETAQMAPASLFGSSSLLDFAMSNQISGLDKITMGSISTSNSENISLTSFPQALKRDKINNNNTNMVEDLGSTYSNDLNNQNIQLPSSSNCSYHMTATALLQKAAQMASTRSNPSFLGTSLGVEGSSSSKKSLSITTASSPESYSGGAGGRELITSLNMGSLATSISELDQLMKQPSTKSKPDLIQLNLNQGMENSLTMNFLGMGARD